MIKCDQGGKLFLYVTYLFYIWNELFLARQTMSFVKVLSKHMCIALSPLTPLGALATEP